MFIYIYILYIYTYICMHTCKVHVYIYVYMHAHTCQLLHSVVTKECCMPGPFISVPKTRELHMLASRCMHACAWIHIYIHAIYV